MGSELREQPRFRDLAAHHPARPGGVVEHHRRRGAAPAAEDLEQPGAQALRPLRHEGDALPVVRVRKRRDRQPEVEGPPADRGAEVPEIDLAGAGRPLELEVPLSARRRPGEPELADEPPRGGVRAAVAALGDEPVVDPPGGAALLPRGPGSASGTPATHSPLPSSAGLPLLRGIGAAGGMSSMSAYFATVFRLARSTRAPRTSSARRHPSAAYRSPCPGARSSPPSFPGGLAKVTARENHTARAAPPVPGARPSCLNCSFFRAHGARFPVITRTTS